MAESKMVAGDDGAVRPWPWTVNSPRGPRRFKNKHEALKYIRTLIEEEGVENVDIGMMQINVRWNGHRTKYNVADLLEPETNIRVAAQILSEELQRSRDLHLAVGRYHSPHKERAERYAGTVFSLLGPIKTLYPSH